MVGIVLVGTTLLGGCASVTSENTAERTGTTAIIGGMLGAVHCFVTDREDCGKDILIGAAIGAIAGEVAHRIRKSYAERDKEIAEISKETGVKAETGTYVVLEKEKEKEFEEKIKQASEEKRVEINREQAAYRTVVNDVFAPDSVTLLPMAEKALRKIADKYLEDGMRNVLIVGHTDSIGTAIANQRLSEQRAQAVARVFVEQGYLQDKVYYQGAGEAEPVSSNATTEGQSKNRRIEIVDASSPYALGRAKHIFIHESQQSLQEESVATEEPPEPPASPKLTNIPTGVDSVIDFGGKPLAKNAVSELLQLAQPAGDSGAFFMSQAHASTAQGIPNLIYDDLPISGVVKRSDRGDAELYDLSDYMPGYENAVMYAHFDQQLFSIHPVSLLQERSVAVPQVGAKVYRDKGDGWEERHKLTGTAVVYPVADNASHALYRWKAHDATVKQTGVLGADILLHRFEKKDFGKIHQLPTLMYYLKQGAIYIRTTALTIKLPVNINPEWRFFK